LSRIRLLESEPGGIWGRIKRNVPTLVSVANTRKSNA
jgi:hypothetical protein